MQRLPTNRGRRKLALIDVPVGVGEGVCCLTEVVTLLAPNELQVYCGGRPLRVTRGTPATRWARPRVR